MKLWYQSLGVSRRLKTGPYVQALNKVVARAAAAGTTVDVFGLSEGRAIADQYRYLEYLDTQEILDNGLKAEREGYDAFLIGNIFEPGLHALRELINIPVLGLCESSVHVACLMGTSFSIVNVNPKFTRRVVENITSYGLASRLVSIDRMQVERASMFDSAYENPEVRTAIVEQFMEAARAGLAKGAEAVIPAGGNAMTLLADADIHQVDNAPIVNGVIALVKVGEMAVGLRQITGSFTSKRMTYAPPSGALLQDIRRFYGANVYPGAA
jgi:Asp/Glu/hydantoin racemase